MRRMSLFLALLALACLSRISYLHHLQLLGVAPDLVLVLLAVWALVWGYQEAMVLAPLAGVAGDLVGTGPVGISVLGLAPVVLLASVRQAGVMEVTLPLVLAVVALGTLAQHMLVLTALAVIGQGLPWGEALLRAAIPAAVVNLLVAPALYFPLRLLRPLLGPPPQRLWLER